jgi:hypothetical protein
MRINVLGTLPVRIPDSEFDKDEEWLRAVS